MTYTIKTLSYKDLGTETSVHTFTKFASDLRLPVSPAKWQKSIKVTPDVGNGQPLEMIALGCSGARYRQGNGCLELRVIND